MIFCLFVESPGIEPGSKQAIKELSTRLFPDWIFVVELGQEQPLNTYLLNFEIQLSEVFFMKSCANVSDFAHFFASDNSSSPMI